MNDFGHLFLNPSKVAASCLRIGLSSFTTVIQMFVLHIFAFNKRANRSEGNANFPPSSHNLSFLVLPRLLHSLAKWLTHADGKTPTPENQLLGNAAGSPSSRPSVCLILCSSTIALRTDWHAIWGQLLRKQRSIVHRRAMDGTSANIWF